MHQDNHGSQSGNNSINVGVGDFRGANVSIGGGTEGRGGNSNDGRPIFSAEEMEIKRHLAFGGRSIKTENFNVFGIVTGVVSVIGLYFTLFQPFPQPRYSSWSAFFVFMFGIAVFSFTVAVVLRRRKFEPFIFRKYYMEASNQDRIYMSSFTATCPWCQSKMRLRNVGPKNGPRDDQFICERNPRQHTIELDPTILDVIDE